MTVIIRVYAYGGVIFKMYPYIEDFDAERGLSLTLDEKKAKQFKSHKEALHFWQQQLPQGVAGHNLAGPNRPLTALTVEFLTLKEEGCSSSS